VQKRQPGPESRSRLLTESAPKLNPDYGHIHLQLKFIYRSNM
jgi:hypothetical protein